MSRTTPLYTVFGLTGLVLAMLTAIGGGPSVFLGLGFAMMTLGLLGALIGAANTLRQTSRSAK